jgi:hypothetical protein
MQQARFYITAKPTKFSRPYYGKPSRASTYLAGPYIPFESDVRLPFWRRAPGQTLFKLCVDGDHLNQP